jgi:hypothetical protein
MGNRVTFQFNIIVDVKVGGVGEIVAEFAGGKHEKRRRIGANAASIGERTAAVQNSPVLPYMQKVKSISRRY